ncbi:MAG: recombinase family protein [Butyrivibrio sp.]|nr:recombinase family protein [Butyrivibrio sp.]
MKRKVGYARVSHKEQNEARQIVALKQQGIEETDIYLDKQSGKDFNRPQYQRMLSELNEDDVLFIHSIDRLGRNYEEIIEQWKHITKELKIDIVVIDMPILDTREEKNLIGSFISDIVLYILSLAAELERTNIKSRQAAGIAAAKDRGVKFGRSKKEITPEFKKTYLDWQNNLITASQAAARCNMGKSTWYRLIKEI